MSQKDFNTKYTIFLLVFTVLIASGASTSFVDGFEDGDYTDNWNDQSQSSVSPGVGSQSFSGSNGLQLYSAPGTTTSNRVWSSSSYSLDIGDKISVQLKKVNDGGGQNAWTFGIGHPSSEDITVWGSGYYSPAVMYGDKNNNNNGLRSELNQGKWHKISIKRTGEDSVEVSVPGHTETFSPGKSFLGQNLRIRLQTGAWNGGHNLDTAFDNVKITSNNTQSTRFIEDFSTGLSNYDTEHKGSSFTISNHYERVSSPDLDGNDAKTLHLYNMNTDPWMLYSNNTSDFENTPSPGDSFVWYSQHTGSGGVGSTYETARFGFAIQSKDTGYFIAHGYDNFKIEGPNLGNTLASTPISTSDPNGVHKWRVDWEKDGTINLRVWDPSGTLVADISTKDTTYTEGGISFRANSDGSPDVYWSGPKIIAENEPSFVNSSISPANPDIGDSISYSANTTDNGSIQETCLDVKYGGSRVYQSCKSSSTPKWQDIFTPATGGKWLNASLNTTDNDGKINEMEINKYISNDSPRVSAVSPIQTNVDPTNGVDLEVDISDNQLMNITFFNGSGSSLGRLTDVNSGTHTYSWTDLSPDESYSWYAEVTDGEKTNTTSTLSFTTITVDLSWTDNSNNENGFNVYSNTSGTFNKIRETNQDITSYTDSSSNLEFGKRTCYRVTAYNSFGESSPATGCVTP